MAYRRGSRSRYSNRSTYGSRGKTRRRVSRRRVSRGAPQRIVIEVIGGPGGLVPVAATTGKKGRSVLLSRH